MTAASPVPHITVAVDPGTERAGVSIFLGQTLKHVHLARASGKDPIRRARDIAYDITSWTKQVYLAETLLKPLEQTLYALAGMEGFQLVIEYPQVYKHGPGAKVAPDSVLAVATAVGAIIAALPEATILKTPRPREWKGQVPKEVMNTRTVMSLSEAERAVLRDAGMAGKIRIGTDENVLDSAGLGIYAVGRPGRTL